MFGFMKTAETEQSEPEPEGPFSRFFTCLPEEKSISNAFIAFGISGLLIFVSIFQIFSIITNPGKFVVIFTMAVIALLVGLAQWNGPQVYMNKIFQKENLKRTGVLFGSMIASIFFSLIWPSYFLSLICCLLQMSSIMYFFCNTFPMYGAGGIKNVT